MLTPQRQVDDEEACEGASLLASPPAKVAVADSMVPLSPRESNHLEQLLQGLRGKPDGMEKNLDVATLKELLLVLRTTWLAALGDGNGWTASVLAAIDRFGLHDSAHGQVASNVFNLSVKDILEAHRKTVFQVVRLQFAFRQHGIIESAQFMPGKKRQGAGVEDVGGSSYSAMFGQLLSAVAHFKDVLVAEMRLRRALDSSVNAADPTPADPWRFVPMDMTDVTPRQGFFLWLLNELQAIGYRRYNKACYEQIMSPPIETTEMERDEAGLEHEVTRHRVFPTHAWRHVCDIRDFIRDVATKEDKFAQWKNMTQPGNLDEAVKFLEGCPDPEFSELKPDRHWFAFQDGLLYTSTATFYGWGDPSIPADVVACRYFDAEFNAPQRIVAPDGTEQVVTVPGPDADSEDTPLTLIRYDNWYDIPTPAVQQMLEYQLEHLQWDERDQNDRTGEADPDKMHTVIMWIYVFFGRLLFEVNEKDAWQVLLFVVGRAGTGKSTLLDALAAFFQPEDVEVMGNKGRKGDGGLQTFVNKFLWMCREVKQDLTLDQADLQSMVTGETMSITVLYGTNLTVTWKVPGVLAGNEPANWSDNSGSISRRIIMAFFERKVKASLSDPMLKHKIKAQMPAFLYKCCLAYLSAVGLFGERDLWGTHTVPNPHTGVPEVMSILPLYFHSGKKRLQALTHPLENFLRSADAVKLVSSGVTGSDNGMPFERFKELANLWMERNLIKGMQWKEDKYNNVFEENDIRRCKLKKGKEQEYHGRHYPSGTWWVFGVMEQADMEDQVEGAPPAEEEAVDVGKKRGREGGAGSGRKAKRTRNQDDDM